MSAYADHILEEGQTVTRAMQNEKGGEASPTADVISGDEDMR